MRERASERERERASERERERERMKIQNKNRSDRCYRKNKKLFIIRERK